MGAQNPLKQAGIKRRNLISVQDAFEHGVQVLGASVDKAGQLLARFDRQGRGQHRGNGLVE